MNVEILCIDDCPNTVVAFDRARTALDQLGLHDVEVTTRSVRTVEEAQATAFAGSPTIAVDGVDLFPSNDRMAGLACRVHATDHGLAGSPSVADITAALRARA